MDKLQNLNASFLCCANQGILLRLRKVGWYRDDSSVDLLSNEIRRRRGERADMASGDFRYRNGISIFRGCIEDGKCDCRIVLQGVCGLMAWSRVYRFEAVPKS
jgi:hypothetical protein